jgi:hypothetical protein
MHRVIEVTAICIMAIGCRPTSRVVPDEVSCAACEITVEAELRIGPDDGPGSLPGRPTQLVRDSLGRFWITMLDYRFPFVFDSDGRFLQQFGSPGEGPGEFRSAMVIAALPGDSVLLQSYPSYFAVGPELRIDRAIRGSVGSMTGHRIASWPHEVIAQKITYSGGVANAQVMNLDMSGSEVIERATLLQATGANATILRRVEPASPHAGMWIAEVTRYLLRRHGRDSSPQDSLERRPEWFPAGERYAFGAPNEAPTPVVNALRIDAMGRLWVYIDRPQANWSAAWRGISFPFPPFRGSTQEVRVASLPPSYALWRTVVEVIDPAQRRVIVRKELDGHVVSVLGTDRIATFVESESGIPVVTISKLTLIER